MLQDSKGQSIHRRRGAAVGALLAFAAVLAAGPVRAQNWRLTAGAWVPDWTIGIGNDRLKSDFEPVPEAALDINRGKLFGGLRLGAGTFSFRDDEVCNANKSQCVRILGLRADLRQIEAVAGYAPRTWLGPYVGLLVQSQELRYHTETDKVTSRQNLATGMAGVIVRTPIGPRRDLFYARAAFVGLEMQDTLGAVLEAGTALTFKRSPVVFLMAMRYQNFYYKSNDLVLDPIDKARSRDIQIGLSAGIQYDF